MSSLYKQLAFGAPAPDYSSMASYASLGGPTQAFGNTQAMGTGVNNGPMTDAPLSVMSQGPLSYSGGGMGNFSIPQLNMGGAGGGGGGFFGGMSGLDKVQAGVSGLATIANIWGAFQAQKMAKKSFKFNKELSLTNLGNQVKSYNTALLDRARSRAVMESQSDSTRDAYVRDNSLSNKLGG